MTANIIDGRALAKALRQSVKAHVALIKKEHGFDPLLAVIIVGDDPASQIYVENKKKFAGKAGIGSIVHALPENAAQSAVLELVGKLNRDANVHGILVQLPLPTHIDPRVVLQAIDPAKDVDGLHPDNMGRLLSGLPGLVPCTPLGCLALIKSVTPSLKGLHAVVVGRSNLVGKPTAQLLLQESCTVTVCHSQTKNPAEIARQADIVVAAAGRAGLITKDWVKPGAIVIDVGITRMDDGSIIGDVDFKAVSKVAGHITPVPGGVGPMTIAFLLANTIVAACWQKGVAIPHL